MQTFLLLISVTFICVIGLMQWVLGWSYLLSASRRREIRETLRAKSRVSRFAEGLSIVIGFLIVNLFIAGILWRIFVGPIKPVHEW